ncbi:hypothetical protein FB451DRAFT_1391002 [Mycena latifolia]|nr:hypothetical protein FB451DRAFT_1391002 [Mycena latifolia]
MLDPSAGAIRRQTNEFTSEGDDTPCIVSVVIKNEAKNGLIRSESSWLAVASLFAASADAISSQMEWFLVSMILHPEAEA